MLTYRNDFFGPVSCVYCDWEGEGADLLLTFENGEGVYVCPECFSQEIYDF